MMLDALRTRSALRALDSNTGAVAMTDLLVAFVDDRNGVSRWWIPGIGQDVSVVGQSPPAIAAALPGPAPDAPRAVFVRAFEYPQGYPGHTHRHRLAQVVYPVRGVVSVEAATGTSVLTRLTALAIPPWLDHRVAAHGNASSRSVF